MQQPLRLLSNLVRCGWLAAFLLGSQTELAAQMLDPAIDQPDEPFSYFSRPADVIGVMDAPSATLVTAEGYLYTGYGELMFFTDDPPIPVSQRVKTLDAGYLPIVKYGFTRHGMQYQFTMFAATLDGKPEGLLVNFVRVKIRNVARAAETAHFWAAVRYENEVNTPSGVGDNRFRRPAAAPRLGAYSQPGEPFSPDWVYGFEENAFLRDQRVLYTFPSATSLSRHLTLKEDYNYPSDLTPRKLPVLPSTPVGVVEYAIPLASGQESTLVFKMPQAPVGAGSEDHRRLNEASFDGYEASTADFWNRLLERGIDISVPEAKAENTFKANLIYDLIARDKIGDQYVQTVNKFHYHAFWLRDASFIVRMYDLSGYHDFARQALDFFAGWQQEDGNFVSQGGQFDGWGQTLWAYGEHYRITHDPEFARRVFPAVAKAVGWLERARRLDPLHLVPSTTPGDNENITGHVTGHNFWALAGLKNAIQLAEGAGQQQAAGEWRSEYEDFRTTFVQELDRVTSKTGGYIPPGLEGQPGEDWGNMLSVYPETILDPFDRKVTATLAATRAKYQEGIMTYGHGRFLHHYLTMKNTETEVIRGDQETALEEFYALLVHTSSTHAGFEYAIRPWSTRDFSLNLSPHGWFAAKFRALMRNMLVREHEGELHLASVVSPEWIQPGKTISVRRAPTDFGQVNFDIVVPREGALRVRLDNHFVTPPDKLLFHLPWFVEVTRASVDQATISSIHGALTLPVGAREIELSFRRKPASRALSYEGAVEAYKVEYKRRYESSIAGEKSDRTR